MMSSNVYDWDLDMIMDRHTNGKSLDCWIMDQAAGGGHLDIVKWLHEKRTEGCTKSAMNYAAQNGHLTIVNGYMKTS